MTAPAEPVAVIADVHNTFGERHAYVLPAARADGPGRWQAKKVFHVSPFFTLDGTYRFALSFAEGAADVGIDLYREGRPVFVSRLQLARQPLSDRRAGWRARAFSLHDGARHDRHPLGSPAPVAQGPVVPPEARLRPGARPRHASVTFVPGDRMLASPGARADRSVPASSAPAAGWIDRHLGTLARTRVLEGLAGWREGRLTVTMPDGASVVLGEPGAEPHASVWIDHDRFFRRVLLHGDLGVGDAYIDGDWRADDLALVVDLAFRNQQHASLDSPFTGLANLADTWRHRRRKNTTAGSRRNIYAHYDLGNAFFSLFLDPTMAYSSGVFRSPERHARGGAAREVPAVGRAARAARLGSRARNRIGVGRAGHPSGAHLRVPGHEHHGVAGAARHGHGPRGCRRARPSGAHRAARLPAHRGAVPRGSCRWR